MPLPSAGPHCTVGTSSRPPCVTVAEKSIDVGSVGDEENSLCAVRPLASWYSNVSVAGAEVTRTSVALGLKSACASVASRRRPGPRA